MPKTDRSWGSVLKAAREQRDEILRIVDRGSPEEKRTVVYRLGVLAGMTATADCLLEKQDVYLLEFDSCGKTASDAIQKANEERIEIERREKAWNDKEHARPSAEIDVKA